MPHSLPRCLTLAAAVALSACEDSPTDPLIQLVALETAPALDIRADLPTVPSLVARTGSESDLSPQVDRWMSSWDAEEGSRVRDEVDRTVASALTIRLGRSGVTEVLDPLHRTARLLAGLEEAPTGLRDELAEVLELARASEEVLPRDPSEALHLGLRASDRLRSLAPESVALGLVVRAEALVAEVDSDDTAPDSRVGRGVRLLRGARRALRDGDAVRAIERAFYACQLLKEPG